MIAPREMTPPLLTRRMLCIGLFAAAATFLGIAPAFASHTLGGHISWVPNPAVSPNTVDFTVTVAFGLQADLSPPPTQVGDIFQGQGNDLT